MRGRNILVSAADHQRSSTSASKSMGLHPHGKWESEIGTSYHQILQALYFPPRRAASTSCEHCRRPPLLLQHRQGNYAKFGLAPCRQTPPFSLLTSCDLECSKSCDVFNFFSFVDFLICRPPTFITHHSIHLISHHSMLVASNTSFDPPELVFTSDFPHRCRILCCRQILIFGEESLATKSLENLLLLLATLVAHGNYGLCSSLLADGIWILKCAMRWIAGMVFSSCCSLEELCQTSR